MEFDKLMIEKLHPFFIEKGLIVTEKTKYFVIYESKRLAISLVHDPRENSNTLSVLGKRLDGFSGLDCLIVIDNHVMRYFFKSNLKIANLPQEIFINNVFLFFTGVGINILKEDDQMLVNLLKFGYHRNKKYTSELLERQELDSANKAWKKKDYASVIKYLNRVDESRLSPSFKQKYKIAKKRISN